MRCEQRMNTVMQIHGACLHRETLEKEHNILVFIHPAVFGAHNKLSHETTFICVSQRKHFGRLKHNSNNVTDNFQHYSKNYFSAFILGERNLHKPRFLVLQPSNAQFFHGRPWKKWKSSEQAGFFASLLSEQLCMKVILCFFIVYWIQGVGWSTCWSIRRNQELHEKCKKVVYETAGTKRA